MQELRLSYNKFTGEHFLLTLVIFLSDGIRVNQKLKKTFLLHRQHSDGARAVHGYDGTLSERQPIDR